MLAAVADDCDACGRCVEASPARPIRVRRPRPHRGRRWRRTWSTPVRLLDERPPLHPPVDEWHAEARAARDAEIRAFHTPGACMAWMNLSWQDPAVSIRFGVFLGDRCWVAKPMARAGQLRMVGVQGEPTGLGGGGGARRTVRTPRKPDAGGEQLGFL
jgi:hypothetical protein